MSQQPQSSFAWKLVFALVPLGLVFAVLTIGGWLPGVGATQWTALALLGIVGVVVGLRAPGRPFRHGLVAGFLAALAAIWAQALFLDTYFSNNPEYADIEIPFGWTPRLATFVLGPLNAVLAGLITSVVAWLAGKAATRLGAGS